MGWPTKGSGKSYNSDVGFGVCVGSYSKKYSPHTFSVELAASVT